MFCSIVLQKVFLYPVLYRVQRFFDNSIIFLNKFYTNRKNFIKKSPG
ncbi:hypothetical protein HMPREF9554_02426 [Treponema phagedenis F0421]|nr:hypothetical protein HMPREF9554_02426 [Treponema phagedenis F0421]